MELKNKVTGEIVKIPDSIVPENWLPNPYWMYRKDRAVLEHLLKKYTNREKMETHEIKELANYFLQYSLQLVSYAYVTMPKDKRKFYLEQMLPYIKELKKLHSEACLVEHLDMMISIGLDAGVDPI